MHKLFVLISILVGLFFHPVTFACGKEKGNVVVPKMEPVEFKIVLESPKGPITITSKKFVVDSGYEEKDKGVEGWYNLKVSPGGHLVVLKYQFTGLPASTITGKYQYSTYAIHKCMRSPTVTQWDFQQNY